MTANDLRQEAQVLVKQRDSIQRDIDEQLNLLRSQPGLRQDPIQESLLDSEGFPRSDIDIVLVRNARKRLIELTNDFNVLTEKIAKALECLHQTAPASSASQPPAAETNALWTWAYVDGVSPESPAAVCGLQRGDCVLQFGSLSIRPGAAESLAQSVFQDLASLVASHENRPVIVLVCRNAREIASRPDRRKLISLTNPEDPHTIISLTLVPKRWDGRGLLGCHIVPINGS